MGYADDTMAEITREAWEDWQTRYEPVLDEMLNLEDTHQLMTDQLGRVTQNEQNSLNTAQETQSNDMGRYGLASASSHKTSQILSARRYLMPPRETVSERQNSSAILIFSPAPERKHPAR